MPDILTDSDLERAQPILTDADLDAPREKGSFAGNLLRSAAAGFTYGFDDEIAGALDAATGGSYEDTVQELRRRKERFAQEHPYWSGGANIAGAITSMALPVGWLGRLGAILPNVNLTRAAVTGQKALGPVASQLPTSLQRVVTNPLNQMGVAGAKAAALTAAGEGEGLQERIGSYLDPGQAALNYGLGAGLGWAGLRGAEWTGRHLGNALDLLGSIRREGGSGAVTGGASTVARYLGMDDASADALRRAVLPGHRNPDAEPWIEPILRGYYDRIDQGLPDRLARQELHRELMARNPARPSGQPYAPETVRGWINTVLDRYQARNEVPANVMELAALATGGEGKNAFSLYRYGANAPGEQAGAAVDWARQRQQGQGARMRSLLERHFGSGSADDAIEEAERRLAAAHDLYEPAISAFHANPNNRQALAAAIRTVVSDTNRRLASDASPVGDAVRKIVRLLERRVVREGEDIEKLRTRQLMRRARNEEGEVIGLQPYKLPVLGDDLEPLTSVVRMGDVIELAPIDDLAAFIRTRGHIRDQWRAARGTSLGTELNRLLRDLDAAVRPLAPDWAQVNDLTASAHSLRRAWDAGESLPLTGKGSALAIALRDFRKLPTEEHRQLFRRGLMTQLLTKIEKAGETHDLAKFFSNARSRQVMDEILGPDAAEAVYEQIRRVGLATRTFQATKGSHTEPIRMIGMDLAPVLDFLAQLNTYATPWGLANKAVEVVSNRLGRSRNDEIMRLLGANTENPSELLDALAAIQQAQQRQAASAAYQLPGYIRDYGPAASVAPVPFIGIEHEERGR